MIPNRGAAAHLSAAKSCQGCTQIGNNCLFIDVLLHRLPKIKLSGVLPIFYRPEECREQKRLENTDLVDEKIQTFDSPS